MVTNREKFNVVLKKRKDNKFVVDTQLSDILQTKKKNIELIDFFNPNGFEGNRYIVMIRKIIDIKKYLTIVKK